MKAIVIAARQPIPEPSRNPSDAAQYSSTKPQGGGLSPISAPLHHFLRLAPVSLSPQTPCRLCATTWAFGQSVRRAQITQFWRPRADDC
jgi:hypothetical protein